MGYVSLQLDVMELFYRLKLSPSITIISGNEIT